MSRVHYTLIGIVLTLFLAETMSVCKAQSFPLDEDFTLYSVKEGLPDNYVRTIEQDNHGFIWVGTASGLSCFDGARFTNFYKGADLKNALASDFIYHLLKRKDGKIYAATAHGLSLINPENRKIITVQAPGKDLLGKAGNNFTVLLLLPNGELIAGCPTGICVFDQDLKLVFQYVHFKPDQIGKEKMQFVHSLTLMVDGKCLIIGASGSWIYDPIAHKLSYKENPFPFIKGIDAVRFYQHPDLAFLFKRTPAMDSLILVNLKNGETHLIDIRQLKPDDMGWMVQLKFLNATDVILSSHIEGLFPGQFDPENLTINFDSIRHLPTYHVNIIFKDADQRLWLGTQYGLMCQSFSKQIFRHHAISDLNSKYGVSPYIESISKVRDKFYVGVQTSGVWQLDLNLKPITKLNLSGNDGIWNICNHHTDFLYIGTQHQFLRFSPTSSSDTIYCIGPRGSTYCQFMDRQGHIWAGFHGGILRYDPHTEEKLMWTTKDSTHYFPYNDAWGITETDSGYIWMCGDDWHRFNPFTMKFDRTYSSLPGTEKEEGGAFQVASNGGEELIFMLRYNGLWKWKGNNEPAEKIKIANRAFSFVEEIFPDQTPHCFWLVLKAGIGYINIETGQYRFFNEFNGLPKGEVIKGFYRDPVSDSMYIGMDNGVLSFYRPDLAFDVHQPDIFITGISIVGNDFNFDILKPIILKSDERDFTIQFGSPEYEYASNLTYEYRLTKKEWTALDDVSSVRFANLGYGQYKFEVRSASPNGTFSQPVFLLFTILPFFYETWWFRSLILLAIVGLIYIWFKWRLTQLQKLENMRQSIAADLHDEVGASLTSLQILAEVAARSKDPLAQFEVLTRLKTQTRKATASLREIVWNIHPKNDRLEMFVGELSRYAGEILEDAGISYSIHADPIGPDEKLAIASRQQLARVYKEILSNLVRHSKATNTEISFTKESNLLVICIRDNGRGFDPETTERGNGLNNMTDRMKMIHGQISIQSAINAGTKITFSCRLY